MLAKMTRGWTSAARAVCAALALTGAGMAAAGADEIAGAGATFPQPIYTRWGELYAQAGGATLNYQGIGSGAGVTQIINRTVDFGASDAPVAPERLASNNLLQFPAVIGSVVVAVNVPGIDANQLKLTGGLVAQMYLGHIKMWNDAKIKALNPGIALPPLPVAPVYRADSSGTTNIFTTYLGSVDLQFQTTIGAGSSVNWVKGVGAKGNDGVAGAIRNTKGGFGYVEYAYAFENHMGAPMLQNRSGAFVAPSMQAFAAAAATADWAHAPNMAASMINTAGAPNWPIVSATYIEFPKNPTDAERALNVLKFYDWAFKNGGGAADQLHYIMLPPAVQAQVRKSWSAIKAGGRSIYTGS